MKEYEDITDCVMDDWKEMDEEAEETCGNCNFCEKNDGTPYCVMKDLYTSVDLDQKCDETDIRGNPYFSIRKQS